MGGGERKRTIKLFCPALSKATQLVVWEEQRLDLGSIATTFGLEPSTLKLNGHFISRGLDLIASSVTWKSLISFFSSRGLSTGATLSDALLVDGWLCRAGTKRKFHCYLLLSLSFFYLILIVRFMFLVLENELASSV